MSTNGQSAAGLGVLGYLLPWEAQQQGMAHLPLGVPVCSPALRSQWSTALNQLPKLLPLSFSCSVGWSTFAKQSLGACVTHCCGRSCRDDVLKRSHLHDGMPRMFLKAIFKINSIP